MRCIAFVLAWLVVAGAASAQRWSATISGGYGHLHTNHGDTLFHSRDGAYVDADFNWRVNDSPYPLLLGAGASVSGYYEREDVFTPGSYYGGYSLYSDLALTSLEARAAVPIAIRHAPGWFVMPRLGAGLLVTDYAIDLPNYTEYHTGAAFEIRPALQAGYSWGRMSLGAEVSYMLAWGDFGRLGNAGQELRAGLFFRFKF